MLTFMSSKQFVGLFQMLRVFWIIGVSCVLASVDPKYERVSSTSDAADTVDLGHDHVPPIDHVAVISVRAAIPRCDSWILLSMYKDVIDEVGTKFKAEKDKTLKGAATVPDIVCGETFALNFEMVPCQSVDGCLAERNLAIYTLISTVQAKLVEVSRGEIWNGATKMSETDRKTHADLIRALKGSLVLPSTETPTGTLLTRERSIGLDASMDMCTTLTIMSVELGEIIALYHTTEKAFSFNRFIDTIGDSPLKKYMNENFSKYSKKLVFVLDISSQVLKILYDYEKSWGLRKWYDNLYYDGSSVTLELPTSDTSYAADVSCLKSMIGYIVRNLIKSECPKADGKACTHRLKALQASYDRMKEYIASLSQPVAPGPLDAMPLSVYENLVANIAELKQIWTGLNPYPSISGPSSINKVTPSETSVDTLWKALPEKKRVLSALQAAETFLIDLKKANSKKCLRPNSVPLSLAYNGKNFWLLVPTQHYMENLVSLRMWLISQLKDVKTSGMFSWLSSNPSKKRMAQVEENLGKFTKSTPAPTSKNCKAESEGFSQELYNELMNLISNMKANLNNWFDYENSKLAK